MTLFPIFCSFIAEELLTINNDIIKNYCISLKNKDAGRKVSNQGGWQSNLLQEIDPDLKELFELINEKVRVTNLKLGFEEMEPLLKSAWININGPNNYNECHDHPDSFYSAVYYVSAKANQGDIMFYHPVPFITNYFISNKMSKLSNFNSSLWVAKPTTGTLLIFPSYLSHCVTINNTTEDRISIAFNFGVK